MNTMVGLEASLHTQVSEEKGELMKNDIKPVAAFDVESDGDDDDDDAFALGEFDPEELLKSPLLNNSTNGFSNSLSENSFGTYEVEDVLPSKLCSASSNLSPGRVSDFSQARNYDIMKHRPSQQPLYSMGSRSIEIAASDLSADAMGGGQPSAAQGNGYDISYSNQPVSPPRRMESIKVAMPSAPMNPAPQSAFQGQVSGMDYQSQIPQQQVNYGVQLEQDQQQINYDMQTNGMVMNDAQLGGPPHQTNGFCSPSQSTPYFASAQNNNFGAQSAPQTPTSYTPPMQGSLSQSSSSYGSPSRQSSTYSNMCQQDVSQLQQMQQYVSQMQPSPLLSGSTGTNHANNNFGLSQTIHGEPFRRHANSAMMGTGQSLSQSMHDVNNNSLRSNSFHGTSRFSSGSMNFSNVSIASDIQSSKAYAGELDLNGQSSHSQTAAPLNEAMEKLCESMKRSAMSRSLIKQYSGRGSLMKQGSSRGLMRQNSGRMMVKQLPGGGTVMDDGSSGRGTPTGAVPIRRVSMNAKHHLQHPSRGIYRHDSQQSLNGCSNHSISLHIDGRSMGTL